MMEISEKKRAAVLALPAPQRYSHFIKVVADQNCIWALYQDGWALMGAGDDMEVFPVWPAQEYAALCAIGDWDGYLPKAISLECFLQDLLPSLRKSGTLLGVFPTPLGKVITPSLDQVQRDLATELGRIE
jgi:hypothetical protein